MIPGLLGKKPFTPDDRDITFANLKAAAPGLVLPTPPANFGHGSIFANGEDVRKDWDMNGNGPDDTVAPGFQGAGDCVLACLGHIVREINRVQGRTVIITGKESIADYSAITGYVLNDESTDQGTSMRDAMSYWRNTGILDASGKRHKIAAYVSINPTDIAELWQAAWVFSACAVGMAFTQAQYDQFTGPVVTWDYVPGSPNLGGHAVPDFGRNQGRIGAVSWAEHIWCTPSLYTHQNDETWAFVTEEELHNGVTERGYSLAQLDAFLSALH